MKGLINTEEVEETIQEMDMKEKEIYIERGDSMEPR